MIWYPLGMEQLLAFVGGEVGQLNSAVHWVVYRVSVSTRHSCQLSTHLVFVHWCLFVKKFWFGTSVEQFILKKDRKIRTAEYLYMIKSTVSVPVTRKSVFKVQGGGAHKVLVATHGIFSVKTHSVRFPLTYSDRTSCDHRKSIWFKWFKSNFDREK